MSSVKNVTKATKNFGSLGQCKYDSLVPRIHHGENMSELSTTFVEVVDFLEGKTDVLMIYEEKRKRNVCLQKEQ